MPREKTVRSVREFVSVVAKLGLEEDRMRFFRGHGKDSFKIRPKIYRGTHRLIRYESDLIDEAVIRCPQDFPQSLSLFECLTKLQHYGLPTRLLDLTSNALAALYFACSSFPRKRGEVVIFDIPKGDVKYYNSDTVAVISALARRPGDFDLDLLPKEKGKFNEDAEIARMVYDIRRDKPAFVPAIVPKDLKRVICVRPKLDNVRIAKQDGAFLLFGIDDHKHWVALPPTDWITSGSGGSFRLFVESKGRILHELEQFGISQSSLFPELDYQTTSIVNRFTRLKKRARHKTLLRKKSLP